MVKQYLKVKYDKPGDAFLAMVHRLDRPVSGIIMYAKTGKAGKRIAKIFFNREIQVLFFVPGFISFGYRLFQTKSLTPSVERQLGNPVFGSN